MKTEIRLATSDYSRAESQTVSTHPPGEGGARLGCGGCHLNFKNNEVDMWHRVNKIKGISLNK